MTRRTGTLEPMCNVAVSEHMGRLRGAQSRLNFFLWTSELAYGFVLSSDDPRLARPDEFAAAALKNVKTEAWYPNTAGRIKYHGRVSSFLDQLKRNQVLVAHAAMLMWYSRFEEFLESRVRGIANPRSWGPLTLSLNIPAFTAAAWPLRRKTVLRADFCRYLRNLMTHENVLPDHPEHALAQEWIRDRKREVSKSFFAVRSEEIEEAVQYTVGQAVNHLKDEPAAARNLSLTFFYALFAFTNLDSLAFEIEEALLPSNPPSTITIRRQSRKVRREDMKVASPRESAENST